MMENDKCVSCKKWYKFSSVLWDAKFKNIADIKWKDNGIVVITKILNLLKIHSDQIEWILNKIKVLEEPTEKDVDLVNDYEKYGELSTQEDFNQHVYENALLKPTEDFEGEIKVVGINENGETFLVEQKKLELINEDGTLIIEDGVINTNVGLHKQHTIIEFTEDLFPLSIPLEMDYTYIESVFFNNSFIPENFIRQYEDRIEISDFRDVVIESQPKEYYITIIGKFFLNNE